MNLVFAGPMYLGAIIAVPVALVIAALTILARRACGAVRFVVARWHAWRWKRQCQAVERMLESADE